MTAALAFLRLNGVTKHIDATALYNAMIAIAEKRMDRGGLAAVLRGS